MSAGPFPVTAVPVDPVDAQLPAAPDDAYEMDLHRVVPPVVFTVLVAAMGVALGVCATPVPVVVAGWVLVALAVLAAVRQVMRR